MVDASGYVVMDVETNGLDVEADDLLSVSVYVPDEGTVVLDGKEVSFTDTRDGLAAGISMIHQELSPVPEMTVAENIWLGREPRGALGLVDHKLMVRKTQELLDTWDLDINPKAQMKTLTVARQQMVEIAKAISYDAQIIIMDDGEIAGLLALLKNELSRLVGAATGGGIGGLELDISHATSGSFHNFFARWGEWCVRPTLDAVSGVEHRLAVADDVEG